MKRMIIIKYEYIVVGDFLRVFFTVMLHVFLLSCSETKQSPTCFPKILEVEFIIGNHIRGHERNNSSFVVSKAVTDSAVFVLTIVGSKRYSLFIANVYVIPEHLCICVKI